MEVSGKCLPTDTFTILPLPDNNMSMQSLLHCPQVAKKSLSGLAVLSINTRSRVKKRTWISLVTRSQIECCLCPSQCYKSSKEQTPLLDVSLLGCSVVYKEKQLKRKEHKLKIIPVGGEAIVLALQSKEQTEQWLRVSIITQRVS